MGMSGAKGNYLEGKLLDAVFSNAAFPSNATVYVALFTATPTGASGSGTEATGSGYARLGVTNNATNWPAATGGSPASKSNGTVLTMATATGDWSSAANMTSWGIFDAVTGGNLLYYGPLTENKPVLNGDTPSFAIGAITITES